MSRRYQFTVAIFVLWIVGLYTAGTFSGENPLTTISRINPLFLVLALSSYVLAVCVGVSILSLCLKHLKAKVKRKAIAKAWIFGSFVDNVMPTVMPAGEGMMAYFLNKFYDVPYSKGLAAIGLYVSAWGLSVTFFSAGFLLLATQFISVPSSYLTLAWIVVGLFALITVGWLIFLSKKSMLEGTVCRLLQLWNRIQNKIKKRKVSIERCVVNVEFEKSYKTLESILQNKGLIIKASLAFFIPQLAHAFCIFFILTGFGYSVPFLGVLLIHIFSSIAGLLALIPSGLGVYEVGASGLLIELFGVPGNIAIATVFLYRLIFVWITNFVGGFVGLRQGIDDVKPVKK